MPIEIKVAPPGITISQGRTFMVTNQGGEIGGSSDEGVYAIDTRFISSYRLYINHQPWQLVNSSQLSFYASRFHLTNPTIPTEGGELHEHTIGLTLNRSVGEGIHEDLDILNYTNHKISFVLELAILSDFADLFEVKAKRLIVRGKVQTRWQEHEGRLRTSYTNKDFHRALIYQLTNSSSPPGYANGRIFFHLELGPGQSWHTCGEMYLVDVRK